ncbi:ParB/RepB/Spo0J family partition protein [Candidatus Methanoperedens nitratireducens]|uniref:ParB/RepB/Spo0J family partition protein n=1 Tax=Candidatus Methanoperedens nitratireducens TaxID=1392998 RepID=UPI0015CDF65C|nr:ParB N-terminal domain-containing protein [Candidatus Methanoperedens nitroreducens]
MAKKKDVEKDSKKESEEKVNFKLVSKPVQMMDIGLIDETGWNPRSEESYKDEEYQGLLKSIKENGFYTHEPILLRPNGERFQVIGGHRRFRAAKELELKAVPVVVQEINDQDAKLLIFIVTCTGKISRLWRKPRGSSRSLMMV